MAERESVRAAEPVLEQTSEKWERWQKRRVFVRELAGKYSEIYQELYKQPRVIRSRDYAWKGGPSMFSRSIVNPQALHITQAVEAHIEVLAPGTRSQKHGHMNSAVFYILDGKGHDVHDGVRVDWEAGDVVVVENACVHQHFNDLPDREARLLIMKAKPMFNFFNLLFQRTVELPPDHVPGYEDWQPVHD